MSDILTPNKHIKLSVSDKRDEQIICKISKALSTNERVRILRSIIDKSKSVKDIAKELKLPPSSVARHVEVLADAQLIIVNYQPGIKGHAKYCSQTILSYTVNLDSTETDRENNNSFVIEMPIGQFSHCHIKAPCGMNGKDGRLGEDDNPRSFFRPERNQAEQLWFDRGYISYNFPSPEEKGNFSGIEFSFEICSETVYYNNNWPSDITVYINDVEVLTFTSPGDFGGRRGKLTPEYWPIMSTQFGLLKKIAVNTEGVFLDNKMVSKKLTFDDLKLFDGTSIKLTIGIKDDAVHKGGINIFGKNFGDYPQAIIMKID
ncbi:MAG: ArsR family transcriptional regulator [Clostridia bacterium]|nr:ArsR family transcriptional regulator [Clostridia bacterium]